VLPSHFPLSILPMRSSNPATTGSPDAASSRWIASRSDWRFLYQADPHCDRAPRCLYDHRSDRGAGVRFLE
jgi:hypothetical protein